MVCAEDALDGEEGEIFEGILRKPVKIGINVHLCITPGDSLVRIIRTLYARRAVCARGAL